jgi:hypothetical protein
MPSSKSSISFRHREDADEIFVFPIEHKQATFQTKNAVVMVEYQDDETVLVIAGKLPGMNRYYENYDFDGDPEKEAQHDLAHELLEEAEEFLSEYDPQTDYSGSRSGNRNMQDIYVTVPEEERDTVVMKMWQLLNYLKIRYIEFVEEKSDDAYVSYPSLEDEIVDLTTKSELLNGTTSCTVLDSQKQ